MASRSIGRISVATALLEQMGALGAARGEKRGRRRASRSCDSQR